MGQCLVDLHVTKLSVVVPGSWDWRAVCMWGHEMTAGMQQLRDASGSLSP